MLKNGLQLHKKGIAIRNIFLKKRAQRLGNRLNTGGKSEKEIRTKFWILHLRDNRIPETLVRLGKLNTVLGEFAVNALYLSNYVPKTPVRVGASSWLS